MSTSTATLPIERRYLSKASLVVAAIVIAAATVVVLGLMWTSQAADSGARVPTVNKVVDLGPVKAPHQPIVIDGKVCGQCR